LNDAGLTAKSIISVISLSTVADDDDDMKQDVETDDGLIGGASTFMHLTASSFFCCVFLLVH